MEYLDIVDEQDHIVSKAKRDVAHKNHLLHRAVIVLVLSSKNQVLLQLRKSTKKQYPLYWAGSVNGHVSSGDDPTQAAYKEMKEEIGLETDLKFLGKFIINDDVEHEMVSVFMGRSDGPFDFDEGEIEETKWFDIDKLETEIKDMKMTPHCRKALQLIFSLDFSSKI